MPIIKKVIDQLIKKNISISVAESCTGGLIINAITKYSGVSKIFSYGIISYSNKAKSKYLSVSKNKNEIYADMVVWYKYFMPQTFGSHVTFDKKKLSISTTYIEGPLKDLKTNWIFESLKKNQTRIRFNVEFEFKRFFHQKIAEAFFPLIENKMIESFKVRADEILD